MNQTVHQQQALALGAAQRGGLDVVVVTGEIDIATAGMLHVYLARCLCLRASAGDLIVDLSGVTFADASALNALLRAHYLARDLGVRLLLAEVPASMIRLLQITGLSNLFAIGLASTPASGPAAAASSATGAAARLRPVLLARR